LKSAKLVFFGALKETFSKGELDALKFYLEKGGNVLILLGECGESKLNTNLNYLLEQYGISMNNDCVAKTAFYKYFHPKESLVTNRILNQEVPRVANNLPKEQKMKKPTNADLSEIVKDDENKEK